MGCSKVIIDSLVSGVEKYADDKVDKVLNDICKDIRGLISDCEFLADNGSEHKHEEWMMRVECYKNALKHVESKFGVINSISDTYDTDKIVEQLKEQAICPYPFNRPFIYLDIAEQIVKRGMKQK